VAVDLPGREWRESADGAGVVSIVLLLSVGMIFPAMAESFAIKQVADSVASEGKVFVSVDFDNDGICDKPGVLISVTTSEKIGINDECVLPSI